MLEQAIDNAQQQFRREATGICSYGYLAGYWKGLENSGEFYSYMNSRKHSKYYSDQLVGWKDGQGDRHFYITKGG